MPLTPASPQPRPGWDITREWEGYTIEARIAFRDIKPEEYLGIFFSGGRAPEYLRDDEHLLAITRHFFDAGKPIASVCHGVEIPARADRVRGRRMATVRKCKFDLEVCGGTFVDEPCVIDGNLISGVGRLPFNTDGGGLCNNHPANRGGITKIIEAVRQLRGEAHPAVQLSLIHISEPTRPY